MHPLAPRHTPQLRTHDVDFAAVGPVALVGLPGSGPCTAALRHVAHIEADRGGAVSTTGHTADVRMKETHTTTCVLYVFTLRMRTLFLPGPLALRVVVWSARRMSVFPLA